MMPSNMRDYNELRRQELLATARSFALLRELPRENTARSSILVKRIAAALRRALGGEWQRRPDYGRAVSLAGDQR